ALAAAGGPLFLPPRGGIRRAALPRPGPGTNRGIDGGATGRLRRAGGSVAAARQPARRTARPGRGGAREHARFAGGVARVGRAVAGVRPERAPGAAAAPTGTARAAAARQPVAAHRGGTATGQATGRALPRPARGAAAAVARPAQRPGQVGGA